MTERGKFFLKDNFFERRSQGIPWSSSKNIIDKPCNPRDKRRPSNAYKGPGRYSRRRYWWRELLEKDYFPR